MNRLPEVTTEDKSFESALSHQVMVPEALCSVNVRFEVHGYGLATATGRGATAAEAVRNVTATMAATIMALDPAGQEPETEFVAEPAPEPVHHQNLFERMGRLIVCGLKKAKEQGDKHLEERFLKAVAIVVGGGVAGCAEPAMARVQSQTDASKWYAVDGDSCSCAASTTHRHEEPVYLCKHVLAMRLTNKLG